MQASTVTANNSSIMVYHCKTSIFQQQQVSGFLNYEIFKLHSYVKKLNIKSQVLLIYILSSYIVGTNN